MRLDIFSYLLLFCSTAIAHDHNHGDSSPYHQHRHRTLTDPEGKVEQCGTRPMTEEDERDLNLARLARDLKKKYGSKTTSYQANSPKTIPICFHDVTGVNLPFWPTFYSRFQMAEDLRKLNQMFSSRSCCNPEGGSWCNGQCQEDDPQIQFAVQSCIFGYCPPGWFSWLGPLNIFTACVTRPLRGYRLYREEDELAAKGELRRGTGEIVNIYISNIFDDSDGVIGFAYFPNVLNYPEIAVLDGIVMDRLSMTGGGGGQGRWEDGSILAHEMG